MTVCQSFKQGRALNNNSILITNLASNEHEHKIMKRKILLFYNDILVLSCIIEPTFLCSHVVLKCTKQAHAYTRNFGEWAESGTRRSLYTVAVPKHHINKRTYTYDNLQCMYLLSDDCVHSASVLRLPMHGRLPSTFNTE